MLLLYSCAYRTHPMLHLTVRLACSVARKSNACSSFTIRTTAHPTHAATEQASANASLHPQPPRLSDPATPPSPSTNPAPPPPGADSVVGAGGSEAVVLLPVRHQGEMIRQGFVHREGTGGVLRCVVGASLCPIRFQARTLFQVGKVASSGWRGLRIARLLLTQAQAVGPPTNPLPFSSRIQRPEERGKQRINSPGKGGEK